MNTDVLRRAGIQPRHMRPGAQRLRCPVCHKSGRDDALALTIKADDSLVWFCHRCHFTGSSRPQQLDGHSWHERQAQWQECAAREHHARIASQRQAAERARAIWAAAKPAPPHHAYLLRKRLWPDVLRFVDRFQSIEEALLIPMRDARGTIVSLQAISPRGEKRFLRRGETKGVFALVNLPVSHWRRDMVPSHVAVGEGYATVTSFIRLHEQFHGVAALSAGNLPAVAEIMRAEFQSANLVIVADQDMTGARAAGAAAVSTGAEVWFPGLAAKGVKDWNDLETAIGA